MTEEPLSTEADSDEDFRDEKKENVYRRISFWISVVLATVLVVWYFLTHPPDSEEMQRMRMFFKENAIEVGGFLKMTRDEKKVFAQKQKHPFYAKYMLASEAEREKLAALIHISYDYTPFQYWFNLIFQWIIWFTTFWFLGLMIEGAIILARRDRAKRLAARRPPQNN